MNDVISVAAFCLSVFGLIYCVVMTLDSVSGDATESEGKHVDGSF